MKLSTRMSPARNIEDVPVDAARAEHERQVRQGTLELARRQSAWMRSRRRARSPWPVSR